MFSVAQLNATLVWWHRTRWHYGWCHTMDSRVRASLWWTCHSCSELQIELPTSFPAHAVRTFRVTDGLSVAGYKVSDTMRKGILEVSLYEGTEKELMLGCLASLGEFVWNKCLYFDTCQPPLRGFWKRVLRCSGQCNMADGCHFLQASNFWHPQYCWRYCWLLIGLSWNWRPPLDNPRDYRYVLIRHLHLLQCCK